MKMTTFWENERRKLLGQPLIADDDTQANTAIDAPQAAVLAQANYRMLSYLTEEEKAADAKTAAQVNNATVFFDILKAFEQELLTTKNINITKLNNIIAHYGDLLFFTASQNNNDEALYVVRSKMRIVLKQYFQNTLSSTTTAIIAAMLPDFIQKLENHSRNLTSVDYNPQDYDTSSNIKRILITGFDPFENDVTNFSAKLVLEFKNTLISGQNKTADIYGAIFPVRYEEFDNGLVDNFFKEWIPKVDAILTCSLDANELHFSIERFAGNWRDGNLSDNNKITPSSRKIITSGNAFYETTLPVNKLILTSELTRRGFIRYREDYKTQIMPSTFTKNDNNQPSFPLSSIIGEAEEGSGWKFLSNEIFYRAAYLRETMRPNLLMGHIHVPQGGINDKANFKLLLERLTDEL